VTLPSDLLEISGLAMDPFDGHPGEHADIRRELARRTENGEQIDLCSPRLFAVLAVVGAGVLWCRDRRVGLLVAAPVLVTLVTAVARQSSLQRPADPVRSSLM
jgi:hypothetical protein